MTRREAPSCAPVAVIHPDPSRRRFLQESVQTPLRSPDRGAGCPARCPGRAAGALAVQRAALLGAARGANCHSIDLRHFDNTNISLINPFAG
jgi:hypothetical protein